MLVEKLVKFLKVNFYSLINKVYNSLTFPSYGFIGTKPVVPFSLRDLLINI